MNTASSGRSSPRSIRYGQTAMKRILILTLLLFLFNLTAPMVLSKKAATQSQPQTTEEQTTLPAAAQTAMPGALV